MEDAVSLDIDDEHIGRPPVIRPQGLASEVDANARRVPGSARRRLRHLLLAGAGLALLAGAGVYGRYWWTTGRFQESTDDAYTQSDNVTISPRVSGYIAELDVTDNQRVKAGQVLARIDDRDFRAALDQAKATVASARAQISNIDAQIVQQQSTIAGQRANIDADTPALAFASQDYQRYTDLAKTGFGTVQRAQQAVSDIRQKAAALAHDRAALAAAEQQVAVLQSQRAMAEASLQGGLAAQRQAELNLSYTVIVAPFDGVVGDRSLRLGQYVQPGTALMQIVPMDRSIYVVANFKETQLERVTVGEAVSVDVDSFSGHTFHGTIDSLAPGSGSQFALLPPENATGNFTKIVQRVPVKIGFDADPLLAQLRPACRSRPR